MQRTNIYLDEGQTAALDRRARDEGVTRSELIRRLLDEALAGGAPDQDADLRAIAETAGALRDVEPPPRSEDQRARHLEAMWRLGA